MIKIYENYDPDYDIYRLKRTSEIVESLRQYIIPPAKRSLLCQSQSQYINSYI
jgi:hypothetical protein